MSTNKTLTPSNIANIAHKVQIKRNLHPDVACLTELSTFSSESQQFEILSHSQKASRTITNKAVKRNLHPGIACQANIVNIFV